MERKKSGDKIKGDEERQIEIKKEEIQKLASFLDKSEDLPEVESGSHILLKKDNPEAETASEAIKSINSIKSSNAKDIAKNLIEELSEVEEKIDDKKELAEGIPEGVDNIEKILRYNQQKRSIKN